jgi:hypothetical protein
MSRKIERIGTKAELAELGETTDWLEALLTLLAEDPIGPWIDSSLIDAFTRAHQLGPGSVVDLVGGGRIQVRLQVTPRGLCRLPIRET